MDRRTDGDARLEQSPMMQLTWTPNLSASALHAAESICTHGMKLTDPRVSESLGDYARALGHWIESQSVHDSARTWSTLIGLSSLIDSNGELANSVLQKITVRSAKETATTQLAGLITDVEAAYTQLFPKFHEQILLRARPLQEHWLGFGGGLLAHLGRLTQKELLVEDARVVLVQPILGGSGTAHWNQNLVRIEAVLTNPMVELPEVVRLCWLLSQLHLDALMVDALSPNVWMRLAPLVMLPPVLAAAEVMELSQCDEAVAELAIEQWHVPVPRDLDIHNQIVPYMMDWWETYLQTRPSWQTAMQAFAKMLGIQ